jgi:hypothetical protein
MSQKPNLEGLAAKISESTKAIISYLHAEKLPEPSFAADGPSDYPKVPEVQGPRMELIEAAMDLLRMALGPKDYIFLESVTVSDANVFSKGSFNALIKSTPAAPP